MIPPSDLSPPRRGRLWLAVAAGMSLALVWTLNATANEEGGPAPDAADPPDISISGTLSASLSFYDASGRPDAREPFSWTLRGAPILHVHGVNVPLTVILTEQDRDFRQPLNRLGAHPRLGWATGHLGYSSLAWSPYSLAGQSILGVGVEGAPGKLRFGAIAGRLRRAVEPDSVAGIGRVAPVYQRTGFALRLGGGTEERHAQVVVMRGGDDETSLSIAPSPATAVPEENLVVSAVGHYEITPRLSIDCELAQSAYTQDKLADPDGGYDKVLLKAFGFLMDRRTSTRETQALEAKLGWREDWGGVGVVYKRIDPGYRSMGAYYFNGDLESVTFEPTLKLAANRLRLAGSLGFQHDNLGDGKEVETTRTIGSGRIDWSPSSVYLANLSYSNYGIDQKAGHSPLDSTRVKIAQSTSNLGITQSLTLVGERAGHNAVLVWSRQDMEDRTENGSLDVSYLAHQLNAVYTFTWMPWGLSVNGGFNRSTYEVATGDTEVSGPQVGANLSFWRNRATVGAGASLSSTSVDGDPTLDTTTLQIQGAVRPERRHRITMRLAVNRNDAKTPAGTDQTETRGEIGYAYSF
ncbi:MAG: hypothetical protein R6X25_10355 [Candidatus Krumholzibacteriia bacterium]